MNYWIQNSDFAMGVEASFESPQIVIDAFDNYDWDKQLEHFDKLELAKQGSCPPGLGIVREEGVILHLIPNKNGTAWGHLHTRKSKKLLGVFPSSCSHVLTFKEIERALIPKVIAKFINGDDSWVTSLLQAKGSSS